VLGRDLSQEEDEDERRTEYIDSYGWISVK
jgi:hypothetical protein